MKGNSSTTLHSVLKASGQLILIAIASSVAFQAFAQQSYPLSTRNKVSYELTSDGKVVKAPPGFLLKHGETYNFEIVVGKPEKEVKDFYSYLSKQLLDTYDNLNNPRLKLDSLYIPLFPDFEDEKFNKLKTDLKLLGEILGSDDPASMFEDSDSDFYYLLGKPFLKAQLFGNIFTITDNIRNTTVSVSLNADHTISHLKEVEFPEFKAQVRIADLKKQFAAAYYKESIKKIESLLKSLRANKFYTITVPEIANLQSAIDKSIAQIDTSNLLVCDEDFLKNYQAMKDSYSSNALIKILEDEVIQKWAWLNQGGVKLNPFSFTDEALLQLSFVHDTTRAANYNAYLKSVTQLMIDSDKLNESKTDLKAFENFNSKIGTGVEIYSVEKENKKKALLNKTAANTYLNYNSVINELKFRVSDPKTAGNNFVKSFDAAKQLTSNNGRISSIEAERKVELLVYNLTSKDSVVIEQSSVDTPEESGVISEIKEAGDLISAVAPLASTLSIGLSKILLPTSVTIPKLQIRSSSFEKVNTDQKSNGPVLVDNNDILQQVEKYLRDNNLYNCVRLRDSITAAVKRHLKSFDEKTTTSKTLITTGKDILSERLNIIITQQSQLFHPKNILRHLQIMRNYTAFAKLLIDSNRVQLPPKEIKPLNDPSLAKYSSKYFALSPENKSMKKTFDLTNYKSVTLDGKPVKDLLSISETYNTAPARRLSSSLGLSYVFNSFERSEAKSNDGVITNEVDRAQARVIAGLSIHVFPHIKADDRFIFCMRNAREMLSRVALYGGLSFPKPTHNLHWGISVDMFTGLKLVGGFHSYRQNSYEIINNAIVNESYQYVGNGGFLSLSLEPVALVKLLGIIK